MSLSSKIRTLFSSSKRQLFGEKDYPTLISWKKTASKAAVVLVHGFHGDTQETWAKFPTLLQSEAGLQEWDVHAVGYKSGLAFDVRGIWSADSDLDALALMLISFADSHFKQYKTLAVLAHSMGGLVVQRAILSDAVFLNRVSHIFLFGTPSAGLQKAKFGRRWKAQINDMSIDGPFIPKLRREWDAAFPSTTPFTLRVIAGTEDEFVPRVSSLSPFSPEVRRAAPGNHLEICKPQDRLHSGFRIVADTLLNNAAVAGPLNSARLAIESRNFNDAIRILEPGKAGLDEGGLVQLALAYEGVGRLQDAISLLQTDFNDRTDAMGTLAGRLKRRWIAERQENDANQALRLYQDALEISQSSCHWEQAHYHSTNVAFLKLAFCKDLAGAQGQAQVTKGFCARARDKWAIASEADAELILGNVARAEELYEAAVQNPSFRPRDLSSMLKQATWIAEQKDDWPAVEMLDRVFQLKGFQLNKIEGV